jgi:hypothetical protein
MVDLQLLRPDGAGPNPLNSFEQERREVLESVMGALSTAIPDPDQMAACAHLLHHLSGDAPSRAA